MITIAPAQDDEVECPEHDGIRPLVPASVARPGALKLALCSFAPGTHAHPAELMQVDPALRYIRQQLSDMGAQVLSVPALAPEAGAGFTLPPGIDGVVVFPACCARAATLAALLRDAARPVLVLALGTGDEQAGEPSSDDGNPMASLPSDMYAELRAGHAHLPEDWVQGSLFDPRPWRKAGQWLASLRAARTLANGTVGVLADALRPAERSDAGLKWLAALRLRARRIDTSALKRVRDDLPRKVLLDKRAEFERMFDIDAACPPDRLRAAAGLACMVDQLVDQHGCDGLVIRAGGRQWQGMDGLMAPARALLGSRERPVYMHEDAGLVAASLVFTAFSTKCFFAEFAGLDRDQDLAILSHPESANIWLSRRRPLLSSDAAGTGLMVAMSLLGGPVTLLALVERPAGGRALVCAEGWLSESRVSNSTSHSNVSFSCGALELLRRWEAEEGQARLCVGYGHWGAEIGHLARVLGMAASILTAQR